MYICPQKGVISMANSDEKISKFVQAITQYAQEQRDKIHQEVENFKSERLQNAEQEVLRDSYHLIQKERAELRNRMSREMSRRDLEARKALLAMRRDKMEQVFSDAKAALSAYAGTPAYAERLKSSFAALIKALPAEGTVFEISRRDEPLLESLQSLCPPGCSVELTDDIQLGGMRASNAAAGLLADDTLDARLDGQREWFTDHSGLTIG